MLQGMFQAWFKRFPVSGNRGEDQYDRWTEWDQAWGKALNAEIAKAKRQCEAQSSA